jgi:methylated-DNA-protein-cysteine methyltransferase-like protein
VAEARKQEIDFDAVYAIVRRIPEGRVATYGQIARLLGLPRHARQVGYALAVLTHAEGVPWHRVVNARGEISRRADPGGDEYQRSLLEDEGVEFDIAGRISMARFQWRPGLTSE